MILTMVMMMTIAISASAMTYREARNYARVMSDKLSYELRLTNRQYREVYDIYYRYAENPVRKDHALRLVLTPRQYDKYLMMHRAPVVAHRVPVVAHRHHPVVVKAHKHAHKAPVGRRTVVHTRW